MTWTRRTFLTRSAATALTMAHAAPVLSEVALGAATLTTVSDGSLVLPGSLVFAPMPQDALPEVLEQYDVDPGRLTPECNLALYRDGQKSVLFDVGSGPDFMPTAGQVAGSLDALGLTPEDITHVVFTHAHPDHIWGLLDEFDEPLFPEAAYLMGRDEWDYWWNPDLVNTIGEARAAFAVGARRRMEAIEDRVILFGDGEEILPGIAALASYGHTPGHMSFELHNGNDQALVIGDAIANHHLAFARPDWPSGLDDDPDGAAAVRRRLLDRLADERMIALGFHLPQGGIGRVERDGSGYRFVPGQ